MKQNKSSVPLPEPSFMLRSESLSFSIKLELKDIWVGLFWDVRDVAPGIIHLHLYFLPFPCFPLFHTRVTVTDGNQKQGMIAIVMILIHFLLMFGYIHLVYSLMSAYFLDLLGY